MAFGIETEKYRILIDPGVAYAPRRYGLRPHPIEMERLKELSKKVEEFGFKSDIIIITHYHRDHFDFGNRISFEIYRGKTLLIKHPEEKINPKQRFKRARVLLKKWQSEVIPAKIYYADGKAFEFDELKIKFSEPLIHGNNPKMGYVLSVLFRECSESILYTSDVEGPLLEEQVRFIVNNPADIIIIDGPPTYLLGSKFKEEELKIAVTNLKKIIKQVKPSLILLDHHPLRDLNYKANLEDFLNFADKNEVEVLCYAEYIGEPISMLEARRKELYENYPVERED